MKNILINIILFIFFAQNVLGQFSIDTIVLGQVDLHESRLHSYKYAANFEKFNRSDLESSPSQNVADFLSLNSSLYFKQYGALATASFRGTSSSHTLVLWNDIPINSIANGMIDFSILPTVSGDELFLVSGGNSSVFGSGSVGGSIHINNINDFDKDNYISIRSELGSYGLKSNVLELNHSEGNLSIKASLFSIYNDNSFDFINTTKIGKPLEINQNAKIISYHKNFNLVYHYDSYNHFTVNYWDEDNIRQVPQNMTVSFSDAMQYDINRRFLLSSKHRFKNSSLKFKQAFLKEDFRYTELRKNIDSEYLAYSSISDADFKYFWSKYTFNIGSAYIENDISNTNYSSIDKNEKTTTFFSGIKYQTEFLSINTVLRREWQSGFNVPNIPSFSFVSNINKQLTFRFKYNKNFRAPTFNDRFWAGGGSSGNPLLKPENAWNREFGINLKIINFSTNITFYNLNVSDMIVWQQLDNGIWMPENIDEVWSRGLELKFDYSFEALSIIGNYALIKSTNEFYDNMLGSTIEKQLRYVPINKGSFAFVFRNEDIRLSLIKSYTGKVITTYGSANDNYLSDFFLTDISFRKKIINSSLTLEGKIKNLMDKSYQTYENYPNPGRELQLTLNYIIN